MTCVLSMTTTFYGSPCARYRDSNGDGVIGAVSGDEFGYRWSVPNPGVLGGGETHQTLTSCRRELNSNPHSPLSLAHGKLPHHGTGLLEPIPSTQPGGGEPVEGQRRTMCNIGKDSVGDESTDVAQRPGIKRKLANTDPLDLEECVNYIPPKRISPFKNTPREKKEERKKILKISIQKLRQLDDPELFLRRSVLINNTMKKMQTELRAEKQTTARDRYNGCNTYRFRAQCGVGYDVLNNSCLSNSYLFDDPFLSGTNEKITDDMTDTLMHSLEDRIGGSISSLSSDKDCNKLMPNVSTNTKRSGDETVEESDVQDDFYSLSHVKSSSQPHSDFMDSGQTDDIELKFDHHSVLNDSPREGSKSVEAVFNNLIRALGET